MVDGQQAAVGTTGDDDDVGAVVEHRCELLLGQAQGLLGLLGLGDVDHQTAHHPDFTVRDEGDDVAHPDYPAVGGHHAVVEAVVSARGGFTFTEGADPGVVVGVQGAAAEAGLQPGAQGVAQQAFGVRRDVGVAVVFDAHFPGDGVQAFHQAAVVLLAAAQFVLQGGTTGHFVAESAVDAQDDGQDAGHQQ
ncbi:hypothetical protein D9M71_336100 [compost metagenome]